MPDASSRQKQRQFMASKLICKRSEYFAHKNLLVTSFFHHITLLHHFNMKIKTPNGTRKRNVNISIDTEVPSCLFLDLNRAESVAVNLWRRPPNCVASFWLMCQGH